MPRLKKTICNLLLCVLLVTQVITGIPKVHAASAATELESIIVSGGNFDTGIKINQGNSIQMTFSLSTLAQYKNLFYSDAYTLRNEASNGLYIRHGWYNEKVFTPTVNSDVTILQKKNSTYVNGNKILTATLQSITSTASLKFGDFKGTIKEFKLWNSAGTLVADYIPALDGNKKACMYDKVAGKYYYYSGTCTAGKQVNKTETSTGTNTGSSAGTSTGTSTGSSTGTDTNIKVEVSDSIELGQNTSSSSGNIEYVDELKLNGGTFDTNIKMNQNYSVEIAFTLSTLNQYRNLYTSNVHTLRNEATNGLYAKHGWYNDKVYAPKADEEIVVLQKKNVTYVNDVQKQKATYQSIKDTSVLTFGNFLGTIASFRVWDDAGTLIAEYLPALDTNDKACMYDTVNKKYVYYSGTCTAIIEDDLVIEDIIVGDVIVERPLYGSSSSVNSSTSNSTNGTTDSSTTTFRDELKKMILTGDMTTHNISKYGLTYRQVDDTWEDLKAKECYIALNSYGAAFLSTTKNSDGIIQTIYIYNADKDFVNRYNRTSAAIKSFLSVVDSKMSDLDKIVYAHEYVVKNTTYRNNNLIDGCAGGVLGDGYGKCSGYAEAMILLLHEMDINSYYISSSSMNHGWLMVELDGQYYHIDPTWDNTQSGTNEIYYHRFLLRNDTEFKTIEATRTHYDWYCPQKTGITSISTRFTNWFVHDVAGCMYYYDGLWYYKDIDTNSIYCSNINGTNKTLVIDGRSKSETVKLTGITSGVLKYSVGGTAYTKSL